MSEEHGDEAALLCVPFAGAGASFFHPWRALAGDRWRVAAVELPGRERRLLEDAVPQRRRGGQGLDRTTSSRSSATGTRTVLFGHSLGAVLAYELVHLLTARGVRVERLVVSGSPGPWTQRERRATGLPDEEFLARVEEFAGFRHEALDHPEMRELILPVLQADCEMHENYVPSTDEPVSVPICSLRGRLDGLVTRRAGARVAGGDHGRVHAIAEFPGDHMYLVDRAGRCWT